MLTLLWCCVGLLVTRGIFVATQGTRSSKRGLVYIQGNNPSNDQIWTKTGSDLTWYYDYSDAPPFGFGPPSLEFVPMLFRLPMTPSDTSFEDSVKSQISNGAKISNVMSFNEPDGQNSTGGSSISPTDAAQAYITHLVPLRSRGLKIGLPAVTGSPRGLTWLQNFNTSCLAISATGCVADFIAIHWYGDFQGLTAYLGQVRAAYQTLPIWVTEFAYPNVDLNDTQTFFNQSISYFDSLDYVERYSYFGSFRSSASNIGSSATMLDGNGALTEIGSIYIFGNTTETGLKSSASILRPRNLLTWIFFMLMAIMAHGF